MPFSKKTLLTGSETDPYLLPNSNTLRNKLGLTDVWDLHRAEGELSGARKTQLRRDPPTGELSLRLLKQVHRHLFQDVYEWAGSLRKVNVAKGESVFPPKEFVEQSTAKALRRYNAANASFDRNNASNFIKNAGRLLGEIYAIHPFREGNGRTQRALICIAADRSGFSLDWSQTSPTLMLTACVYSMNNDNSLLESIIEGCLASAR